MTSKDIDFTKVSLPVDEFDALMRRALEAPVPTQDVVKPDRKRKLKKSKSESPFSD